eukprot:3018925-Amphidinium_carterae.1
MSGILRMGRQLAQDQSVLCVLECHKRTLNYSVAMAESSDTRSTLPISVNSSTDPSSLETLQVPRLPLVSLIHMSASVRLVSLIHNDNEVMSPRPEDVIDPNRSTDLEAIPEGIVRRGVRAVTSAATTTIQHFHRAFPGCGEI